MSRSLSTITPPALRPLARGLLLALATLAAGPALAGDLDNQSAEVKAGDPVEAWTLKNVSQLTVNGGQANDIEVHDSSTVVLDGARVTRTGTNNGSQEAVELHEQASLKARNTEFIGGGITLNGPAATADLVGTTISVTTAGLLPTEKRSVGIGLSYNLVGSASPSARIDSTRIYVEDAPDMSSPISALSSGIGAHQMMGELDIVNGSRITAANVGAVLRGAANGTGRIRLNVDNSTLEAGRGAAIRVNPASDNTYDITVANGAQLSGGDGNLLLVGRDNGVANTRTDVNFNVDNARLAGNVTSDPTSAPTAQVSVFLRNKAQIDGRFLNVTSASIDSDSTWLMTGDSNVGHLALGNTGTVALGNGSTFNTLNVDTFDGAGGTLLFNTQLGDDSSATDKLIIKGDSNGQANVRVLNAGGAGAKTDKGIELIRVGGASNAQFDLRGRAVGGQYEYFLFKDGNNGGWYLRSELAGAPDPCVVDPTLPECTPIDPVDPVDPIDPIEPTPVLRPEAGAYLANQFAMDQLLRHGWRDRQGSISAVDGVRGWARVDATQSKLSAVEDQLDLRVDRSRLQLGADIGVFDNGQGRVGVMGTLAKSDATSRSQLTGYSARGKVNGGALGVYGNWNNDALYVDASVQRGQFRNRVQGEGLAEERY
ncbi:autotransporter outer membrane beta-barrel domain-containing protein, partial [Stenotrophomonas maltophilia]|uniref:autotransporter family protein n=1 Tax=Stenotrophomonas maltophilia TaxID=40324 RepID=UPI0021C61C96